MLHSLQEKSPFGSRVASRISGTSFQRDINLRSGRIHVSHDCNTVKRNDKFRRFRQAHRAVVFRRSVQDRGPAVRPCRPHTLAARRAEVARPGNPRTCSGSRLNGQEREEEARVWAKNAANAAKNKKSRQDGVLPAIIFMPTIFPKSDFGESAQIWTRRVHIYATFSVAQWTLRNEADYVVIRHRHHQNNDERDAKRIQELQR